MTALDVAPDASFGLRAEEGGPPQAVPPPDDGGDAVFRAAFRQTNVVFSAIQYMRNSGHYAPVPDYNPINDIKGWGDPRYFLEHGDKFVGSQSPAETQSIKGQIDTEEGDRKLLAANGKIGLVASTMAGALDPTMLLPGGVAIDTAKGGLTFTKAAYETGKAALLATTAQEVLLHGTQQTRSYQESALNVASGTLLTALIGGGAASLLRPGERAALETRLATDRAEMNAHAGNPRTGEGLQESIRAAAVRYQGKTYEGALHSDAYEAAAQDTGKEFGRVIGDTKPQDAGFITSTGRYVDREEAARIANRAGQTTHDVDDLAGEHLPVGYSGTGQALAAGAAASDTRKLELVPFGLSEIPGVRRVVEKTSPMQRVFGADSVTARRTGADLAETSLLFKENLEGGVTTVGPALDREARLNIHKGQVAIGDELSRQFSEYRFGEQKSFPRARAAVEDFGWSGRRNGGNGSPDMSFDEFKEAVSDALRNGDQHEIPQVQMAAQAVRSKIFEPWKKRAIDAGLLPEDVGVKTADSYLSRLYNKQAIASKRPEFVDRVTDWLQSDQATKAQAKDRIEGLSRQLTEATSTIEKATARLAKMKDDDLFREGLEGDLIRATAQQERARKTIEEEIAKWEGKSVAEAKSALKARAKAEEERAPEAKRLKSADKAVDKAVKRIIESDRDLSRDELRSRAQEITDRIIGSPDGRLPYDLGMEHGTAFGGSGEPPRGALAAREFNIPDATIKDFLENDIEHIVGAHLRTMVPDVLLTEKFGDTRMTEAFRKINDEYAAMVDAAKSEKERTRLEKERQGVTDDLAAIRDRIRGTYAISPELPLRNAARAAAVLKNYNVLTSMGSAALSSLPDMAGSVLRHGITSTFNDAWSPFFQFLTKQSDAWSAAAREYRAMGIAVESVLASRHHALTDTLDTYHPQSRVERTLQWATGKFQFVNMLAPWTDFAKINASMVAGSEILRAVKASAEGSISARQLRNLGESGIEPHMAARIAKAFEDGGEIRDGVHLPNTADWTDGEARRVFEGAVARDVDIAVVTPGQEKPLWFSHPLLGVLSQFKSFTAAATERVLISNLQRRDAQVLQGVIFSMGLGMLSYKLNSLTGGQPVSDKPQDWIKEAISRGNLLGWAEEGNALVSKASGGSLDIYRVLGAGKPLSRYVSRSALDQVLGPTAGKIGDILKVTSAAGRMDWNEGDSKSLRRGVALQNVWYLRKGFDAIESSANNAFGIPMKARP